jgi:hypothetical protein
MPYSSFHACNMSWPSHPWRDNSNVRSESKLLSDFTVICHGNCDNNLESLCTWRSVQVTKSLIEQFLQPPITSPLFGSNILLSALFWNTFSLCSSFNIRDQVAKPHKATCKIIFLYMLICTFLDNRLKGKIEAWNRISCMANSHTDSHSAHRFVRL